MNKRFAGKRSDLDFDADLDDGLASDLETRSRCVDAELLERCEEGAPRASILVLNLSLNLSLNERLKWDLNENEN